MKRSDVYEKYGGRCAYCGKALSGRMHIDHIYPVRRGGVNDKALLKKLTTIENVNPSCPRCNLYKSVFSVEQFREEIGRQVERARRYSLNFRLAEDFKLISVNEGAKVKFYFESLAEQKQ